MDSSRPGPFNFTAAREHGPKKSCNSSRNLGVRDLANRGWVMEWWWDHHGIMMGCESQRLGQKISTPKGEDNALQKIPEWWSKRDLKTPLPLEVLQSIWGFENCWSTFHYHIVNIKYVPLHNIAVVKIPLWLPTHHQQAPRRWCSPWSSSDHLGPALLYLSVRVKIACSCLLPIPMDQYLILPTLSHDYPIFMRSSWSSWRAKKSPSTQVFQPAFWTGAMARLKSSEEASSNSWRPMASVADDEKHQAALGS